MVAWTDYKAQAQERGALALELFVIQSTPASGPDAVKAALPDHLAYQRQLEESGHLVMAGPVSDDSGNEMQGAGMIIYRAPSMQAAQEMAAADPMHKSGARSYVLRRWLVNEGSLNLSVGLSTGRVLLS